MISTDSVRQLMKNGQLHLRLQSYWRSDTLPGYPPQFYRGRATRYLNEGLRDDYREHKGAFDCRRHMKVFRKFDIIPEYCFDCYKIVVEPRNVVELFKLMILFEKPENLNLVRDNTRKCMVEYRPRVPGTYKGFIYYRRLQEAEKSIRHVRAVIAREISGKIPVLLKRGCAEFSLAYPEFAIIGKDGQPVMKYPEEWRSPDIQAYEQRLGEDFPAPPDSYSRSGFDLYDGQAMITWLKYAVKIGDMSYLKITDVPLPGFKDLERPPFQTLEKERVKRGRIGKKKGRKTK
jgi:hypothetical protein